MFIEKLLLKSNRVFVFFKSNLYCQSYLNKQALRTGNSREKTHHVLVTKIIQFDLINILFCKEYYVTYNGLDNMHSPLHKYIVISDQDPVTIIYIHFSLQSCVWIDLAEIFMLCFEIKVFNANKMTKHRYSSAFLTIARGIKLTHMLPNWFLSQ